MTNERGHDAILPSFKRDEMILETTGTLVNLVPAIGGAISSVLFGISGDRRFERVREFLLQLDSRLADLGGAGSANPGPDVAGAPGGACTRPRPTMESTDGGEETMRGFHCVDPSHGRVDFTGEDDEDLFVHVKDHAADAHPDLTEGQIREMMAGADWWKEMATSGTNAGSSPSAYDK
jgi:hypothetical protein